VWYKYGENNFKPLENLISREKERQAQHRCHHARQKEEHTGSCIDDWVIIGQDTVQKINLGKIKKRRPCARLRLATDSTEN
jgi:hypothetical protein